MPPSVVERSLTVADITRAQALVLAAEFWTGRGMTLAETWGGYIVLKVEDSNRPGADAATTRSPDLVVRVEEEDDQIRCRLSFTIPDSNPGLASSGLTPTLDEEMARFAAFVYEWAIDRHRNLHTSWIGAQARSKADQPVDEAYQSASGPDDSAPPALDTPASDASSEDDLLLRLEEVLGVRLERHGSDRLRNPNLGVDVVCLTAHPNAGVRGSCRYHFAFTPEHLDILKATPDSGVLFRCADTGRAFLSLRPEFLSWIDGREPSMSLPHPAAVRPTPHWHFLLIDHWTRTKLVAPSRSEAFDLNANLLPPRKIAKVRVRVKATQTSPQPNT